MDTPVIRPDRSHADAEAEAEMEEISVDITDDNLVWVHGEDWELFLAPEESRQLGEALIEAAEDAVGPVE